ncbi:uncharacterized protein C9orf153 homolog isoform 1-T1 [Thomomys bottae]
MSLLVYSSPATEHETPEFQICSLPKLHISVENFNKERKKSNLLKTQSILLKDAQKLLHKNLNAMSPVSRTGVRKASSKPVFKCTVFTGEEPQKEEIPVMSLVETLYQSLMMDSITPLEQLSRSWKRLIQSGINPPVHTFPFEVIIEDPSAEAWGSIGLEWDKTESMRMYYKLSMPTHSPKQNLENKISKYFLVDPERQFFHLKDLEWKHFKGLLKIKRIPRTSYFNVKHDTEKRYVESQNMPPPSPPLLHDTLVICSYIGQKEEIYCLWRNV